VTGSGRESRPTPALSVFERPSCHGILRPYREPRHTLRRLTERLRVETQKMQDFEIERVKNQHVMFCLTLHQFLRVLFVSLAGDFRVQEQAIMTPSASTYALDHYVESISLYPRRCKSDGIGLILHVVTPSRLSWDNLKNKAVGVRSFYQSDWGMYLRFCLVPRMQQGLTRQPPVAASISSPAEGCLTQPLLVPYQRINAALQVSWCRLLQAMFVGILLPLSRSSV
jgi:hypothetical protein